MNINFSANNNINFGVNFSNELIVGMEDLAIRSFKIRSRFKSKIPTPIYSMEDEIIKKDMNKKQEIIKKMFADVSEAFPFRTLHIAQNKKDKKFYFAMDTFMGEKLLAPIRTKNNANPINNPEAMIIRFSDFQQLANNLKKMKFEENCSNMLNLLF